MDYNVSPGKESDNNSMLLTKNSMFDNKRHCRLDVLGIKDQPAGDHQFAYKEFQGQLFHHSGGYYETDLLWKVGHPRLGQETIGEER